MWRQRTVAVIVPAYDEQRIIGRTLARVPDCVDRVYVVDDCSRDETTQRVRAVRDARIVLIAHPSNRGVGAAIATGYGQALRDGCELLAVMAADDQMDPADLPALLEAVVSRGADYAKGNRFLHAEWRAMPPLRRWGSALLSRLTRWATGLRVGDTQCGFTVLARDAALGLPLGQLWPRYGYPNDLLGLLAAAGARVVEVPVRPVYADEDSGLRPYHLLTIALVIARRFWLSRVSAGHLRPASGAGRSNEAG
jgi:glycosyltransferase involved in cell wall biosynthesis